MNRTALRRALAVAPLLLAGTLLPLSLSAADAASGSSTGSFTVRSLGAGTTTAFTDSAVGRQEATSHLLGPDLEAAADAATGTVPGGHRVANRTGSVRGHARTTAPAVGTAARALGAGSTTATAFPALNILDQRTANGGNQYYVEPPDQALCVGGGNVVEAVNDVLAVYSTDGGRRRLTDLNTLLGFPAQFDRATGVSGPFVTDPVCTYDAPTRTFFLVTLTLALDSAGNFTGKNTLDIATAKDPLGSWNVRHLAVQDDGTDGTPNHGAACPCIGDYPHIGADANGFYITTNEYPFFSDGFVAAQVYAFPKSALAGRGSVSVAQFSTVGLDAGRPGFTVWPALSPAGQYSSEAGGTEYFLSSNAAEEARNGDLSYTSNEIVTWSLTGTSTLGSRKPALRLNSTTSSVSQYYLPPLSNQKAGLVPLADCLNLTACAKDLLGKPNRYAEVEGQLDSGDTRMQQVTYAGGKLYGALDTAVSFTDGSPVKAGISVYTGTPTTTIAAVHDSLTTDTIGVPNNNITYPTIGVTAAGAGVLSYTLVGRDHYPSQAYSALRGENFAVTATGVGPQDGFSEYRAFGDPPRPRWGDYGASAVVGGDVWVANETINQSCTFAEFNTAPVGRCPQGGKETRGILGNWGTSIAKITP